MRNQFTLWLCLMLLAPLAWGQTAYTDHFDNDDPAFTGGNGFTHSEMGTEWTITAAAMTGPFDPFTYQPHSGGAPVVVDAGGNNKVYVRAKASVIGTQLRMDLQDTLNMATTQSSISQTLTTTFQVLEYDFSGKFIDAGFGGTGCSTGPCAVDSSAISNILFFPNAGAGFVGTIVIDFISFGSPPDTVITSDVFQDHFEDDSAANSFTFIGQGYSLSQQGSELTITGDGTTGAFDPLTYVFMNRANMDTFDIDITGNNKLFVKVKSSVPNTAFRIDVQDIDGFASTGGSITKIVDTAFTTLEYDFTGVLTDLGFGGTPCTQNTAPCTVDGQRVGNLLFFIEPGTGAFPGQLTIDYLSFGVALEPPGPAAELIYEDHFNNEMLEFTTPDGGYTVEEMGSELSIIGDGTAGAFSTVSYLLHDKDSASDIFLNMTPGQNKVFVRAKVMNGTLPLRLDLIDTANYHTSLASLTKVVTDEWNVYEYDFSGQYNDGGYGGTACATGPCPVDFQTITQVLLFPDAVQGGFNDTLMIDFISIGQPLGEDAGPKGMAGYMDQMDDNTNLFISPPAGFTSTTANDEWTLSGDGTAGAYAAFAYTTHDEMGENVLVDAAGSNNKLFVRAKSTSMNTVLRVDVQDNQGFVSNLSARTTTLDTVYQVYELDFAGAYQDGAFGGSPCTVSGCPVDAERVSAMLFYVDPDVGGFNGDVTIDWISFGNPIVSNERIESVENMLMYPNPAQEWITLEYALMESSEITLEVINPMGQKLIQHNLGNQFPGQQKERVNIQELPAGLYIVQVKSNGQVAGTSKLIKK
ncbi:MAG: T9SS type A sorting domain-containing protein [Bacteroidota bacterium]